MNQAAFRLMCVALVCSLGGTAQAQTSTGVDVGVGWSFVRFTEGEGLNMPAGWLVSVAGRATDWVSVVGEVAGNYKTESGDTLRIHTFQGGVRFVARRSPHVRPYGQFLLGGMNFSSSYSDESDTEFTIEPGGGVDIPIGGRVAVRAGIGFPMVFVDGETVNAFRFHLGIAF